MVNLKNVTIGLLVLSLVFLAGCGTAQEDTQSNNDGFVQETDADAIPQNPSVPEEPQQPSTSDGDEIAAKVNSEVIRVNEVKQTQQSLMQQGEQVSQEDALEEIINQRLLIQYIEEEEGLDIPTEEAESLLESELSKQGATIEDYKAQLEAQGKSYEEELENIKSQLKIQEYLDTAFKNQSFEVTQKEANEFYEMYKEQSPEQVPSFDELESQIIETLKQEKEQKAIRALIENIRSDANIEYN